MPIGKKSLLLFSPFGAICAPRGKTPYPTKPLWHWRAKLNGAKEREKISVSSAQKRASSSNKHQSTAEWVSFFGCPFSLLCQRVVWGMNGLLQWRLRRRVRGNEFFLPLFSDFGANGEWKVGAGAVSTISLSFLRHEILALSGVMRGRPPVRRREEGELCGQAREHLFSYVFSCRKCTVRDSPFVPRNPQGDPCLVCSCS